MKQERPPVTVEDLIRLKRVEQPPAEFWDRFDRELRAKQLAALVEKRPWWRNLPQIVSGVSRYSLPLGATAILALTFFATRDYSPSVAPTDESAGSRAVASAANALGNSGAGANQATFASSSAAQVLADSQFAAVLGGDSPSTGETTDALSASQGEAQPAFAVARMEVEEVSPSARHIAANLAAAQAAAPAVARGLLSGPRSFEDRALSSRFATEPLEQVSTPAERSRARFATAMVTSFNGETRSRVSGPGVTRRISDDRVYDDDAIRRVGATGNSVAWRF